DNRRSGGFIRPDPESARALTLLQAGRGVPQAALVVGSHSDRLSAGDPAFEAAAAAAMLNVPHARYVRSVISHALSTRQVSSDGHTAYDIVFLALSAYDSAT